MPPPMGQMLKEFARKALVGAAESPMANRIVNESGAVDPHMVENIYHDTKGVKNVLRNLAVGSHPIETLKQRFQQGGLVGKGGIVRGAAAADPEFSKAVKQHGLLKGIKEQPFGALSSVTGPGFLLGMPAYDAVKSIHRGDTESAAGAVGDVAGWSAGMPFGLAGAVPATAIKDLIKAPFKKKQPSMPQIAGPIEQVEKEANVSQSLMNPSAVMPKIAPINIQPPASPVTPNIFQAAGSNAGGQPMPTPIQTFNKDPAATQQPMQQPKMPNISALGR